ncbi:MAG: hypothetical protein J7577_16175 [Sphingobacteriaceae bacterium]|nr:hypothetical protein [Sphingobacteriaceae bacterium]
MKFNNKNISLGLNVTLGNNVKIGDNVTIYDNVTIGDNTIICNNCIIGEPLGDYYFDESYQNPRTFIGENSLIRSHTIIYANNEIGDHFSTGHRVTIRENCVIGSNCRVGTLSDLQGNLKIGEYSWLHSNVHVGQGTEIGNFVFVYPYVIFTNDPHPPSSYIVGSKIGDYTQIAVSSVILPGVEIGSNCLIGASTLVSKKIGNNKLVVGNPGKIIGDVESIISKETGLSHYPWPYNFKRGMPWEDIGYDKWLKKQDYDK